jgi:hypothetical protein
MPAELRHRYHLDRPGSQLEITERSDGVFELRPVVAVPADQTWFWTERWQQMEREVDDHIRAGRVTRFDSSEEFLSYLDQIVDEPPLTNQRSRSTKNREH